MSDSKYINRTVRMILAFIAAFFVVMHGKWYAITIAFISPMFYVSLGYSFVVSAAIVEWIHYITNRLDNKYPWHDNLKQRALHQVLYSFVAPLTFDLIAVNILLSLQNSNIVKSGYLSIDFPVVLFAVLVINMYYFFCAFKKFIEKVQLEINYNGTNVVLNCNTEIAILFKERKYIRVVTFSGDNYHFIGNLSAIYNEMQNSQLIRLNRTSVLNSIMIAGYQKSKKSTIALIKKEFIGLLDGEFEIPTNITSDFAVSFRNKLNSYKKLQELQNVKVEEEEDPVQVKNR